MTTPYTQNDDASDDDSPGQAPLSSMMNGSDEQPLGLEADEQDTPAAGRSVNSSVVIVLVVAGVLGGALFLLSQLQSSGIDDMSVDAELTAKVEQYLGTGSGTGSANTNADAEQTSQTTLFKNTDVILAMFARDLGEKQVPVEFVKKNPFRLQLPETPDVPAQQTGGNGEKAHQKRLAELNQKAGRLNLQSVMGGAQPVAVIDGELYQVGDDIGPFTIITIDRLRVRLKAAGQMFNLTMDQDG
jgi:hypothetical protein